MKRNRIRSIPLACCVCLAALVVPSPALAQVDAQGNAAIAALRESNPTTAGELVRAIRVASGFDRYDEAVFYLGKLLALELEETDLIALHEQFGSATFLRMAEDVNLPSEGRQFALAVLEVAQNYNQNPQRLAALVGKLTSADDDERAAALRGLADAQEAAVPPLVAALADPQTYPETERYQAALILLGDVATRPLLAVLESPDAELRSKVIVALGRIGSPETLAYLVRPLLDADSGSAEQRAAAAALERMVGGVPSAAQAERYLAAQVERYETERELPSGNISLTPVWQWADGQLTQTMLPNDLALAMAIRDLAGDLHVLWPENTAYRRSYLSALLESEKRLIGLPFPLPTGEGSVHELATAEGVDALSDLLAYALEKGQVATATGACEVLGDSGDLSLLDSQNGRPSLLVQALHQPDRRLRFFAAQAILKLDPQQSFAGADDLVSALGYFARTSGDRRVLVGHPHVELSHTLAGMLNGMGFSANATRTGRATFLEAVNSSDYEMIILSSAIDHPAAGELVQMLRKDPRTASIPIGVIPWDAELPHWERLAGDYPPAAAFLHPTNEGQLVDSVQTLLSQMGEHYVSPEERVGQAVAALNWLAELAAQDDHYGFYNVFSQEEAAIAALNVPETAEAAARLLGQLATPDAQLALVEVASQNARPLAQRQASARGFGAAVDKRGLLLTRDQVLAQYDRYNASATLDTDTQDVLGGLLDTIEAPTANTE